MDIAITMINNIHRLITTNRWINVFDHIIGSQNYIPTFLYGVHSERKKLNFKYCV